MKKMLIATTLVLATALAQGQTFVAIAGLPGNALGGLMRDKAGNFYGTTSTPGGTRLGVVYKVDAKGTMTVLYYMKRFREMATDPNQIW